MQLEEAIGNISTTKETATKETKKKQNQRRTLPFHWFYQLYLAGVFDDPEKERGEDERKKQFSSCKKEEEEEKEQQAAMLQKKWILISHCTKAAANPVNCTEDKGHKELNACIKHGERGGRAHVSRRKPCKGKNIKEANQLKVATTLQDRQCKLFKLSTNWQKCTRPACILL